jgi:hypothetical protein
MEARPSSPALLAAAAAILLAASLLLPARADDPYRFYTWNITFGDIYPLGVKQEVGAVRHAGRPGALGFFLLDVLRFRVKGASDSAAFAAAA